ncbi:hypothetical protein L211DRAFT_853644 [Terfezia boudieri ATCC MYA-4762]|uniref:Uncharacterized protein n=1 Tax=Terfezia boudieri ATCC MYA-4762 TaxID=1051890 RepID=A0A3N4L7U7_9PEZI|nr:hypothetical protein L211DRAFT_853644 [Terfezia boudieri ATCC MYA-4762]
MDPDKQPSALILYEHAPSNETSPLESIISIPEMVQFVLGSTDMSNVDRVVDKLTNPADKQEFFGQMAAIFASLTEANGQLSASIWAAAQRVKSEMESIGAWDTTVEILSNVSEAAKKHQQAQHRKEQALARLLKIWPPNWREAFPDLTFPNEGMESEKFLQELSTVAVLQPHPEQVKPLLEEALRRRMNRHGSFKDPVIRLDEITSVKRTLQEEARENHRDGDIGTDPGGASSRRKPVGKVMVRLDFVSAQHVTEELQSTPDERERGLLLRIWDLMTSSDGAVEQDRGKLGLARLQSIVDAREAVLKKETAIQRNAARALRRRGTRSEERHPL